MTTAEPSAWLVRVVTACGVDPKTVIATTINVKAGEPPMLAVLTSTGTSVYELRDDLLDAVADDHR